MKLDPDELHKLNTPYYQQTNQERTDPARKAWSILFPIH